MRLHLRNMAIDAINQAGADLKLVDEIVSILTKEGGKITADRIKNTLDQLKS